MGDKREKPVPLLRNEIVDVSLTSPPNLQVGVRSLNLATMEDFFRFYEFGSDGGFSPRMRTETLSSQVEPGSRVHPLTIYPSYCIAL